MRWPRCEVVIITGQSSVETVVQSIHQGAIDYLAKPFALQELEARVRALTRRGMAGGPTLLKHGALSYDQVGRTARVNGPSTQTVSPPRKRYRPVRSAAV